MLALRRAACGRRAAANTLAARARTLSTSPLELTQHAIAQVQMSTGAPWYMAIAGSAVALRVAILPTVLYQVREARRLVALRPKLLALRQQFESIKSPAERATTTAAAIWRECRANDVQPLAVFALPFLQLPFLIGLVVSIRRMLYEDSPYHAALQTGGVSPVCKDLTARDPTGLLPIASLVMVVANLQMSMGASRSPIICFVRDLFQAGATVALPVYAQLPAGVYMYLLPNSIWSCLQLTVLRRLMPIAAANAAAPVAASQAAAPLARAAGTAAAKIASKPKIITPAMASGAVAAAAAKERRGTQQPQTPGAAAAPSEEAAPTAAAATPSAPTVAVDDEEAALRRKIDEAAEANSLDLASHVELSKRLLRAKRPEEAASHLWPAVQAAPREASAPLRFQLALALSLQGQHDVAEPLLEQVLQLEPSFAEAHLCLCSVQEALGKVDDAVATLRKVVELKPELKEYCAQEEARMRGGAEGGGGEGAG